MARYGFGGGIADWTFTTQDAVGGFDDMAQVVGGATVTLWNAETGGTQIIDLLDASEVAIEQVVSSDGSDGRAPGTIPPFQGPDGVTELWASANGGPRQRMTAKLGQAVAAATLTANQASADLAAHVAAPNPHSMASNDLTDYSDATPEDGQVPIYRTAEGRYVPELVEGLDPADFVNAHGGSEIVIPSGDITTEALVVRVPAGDRAAAVNTFEVWWNAGSEAVPNWVLVTRLDEYGQFRARASRNDRVYGKVQALTGQTGDLLQFTDAAGNPLSWVDAGGRFRAPNLGIMPAWTQDVGAAGVGQYRVYNPTGGPLTLRGFVVSAGGTAPAGGDFVIEPKLDGVALYSSANRPKIVSGGRTSGVASTMNTATWPAGSYLTVDVLTVPTTAPTKVTIQALAY